MKRSWRTCLMFTAGVGLGATGVLFGNYLDGKPVDGAQFVLAAVVFVGYSIAAALTYVKRGDRS